MGLYTKLFQFGFVVFTTGRFVVSCLVRRKTYVFCFCPTFYAIPLVKITSISKFRQWYWTSLNKLNHKRHFITIPFINKGIEFIDLPSIFKDRSVTSSIPAYFQNSEPPIICYKYNKPIRNTVFNFNKLVSDLDIHANTPES